MVVVVLSFLLLCLLSVLIYRNRHLSVEERCTSNLRELGVMMALYAKDNDGRLPYAYIKPERDSDRNAKVWDTLIFPLIPLNSAGLPQKHFFRCPADTIHRNGDRPQRTYAMPMHSPNPANWPPGPDNNTGIGLYWDAGQGGLADITNVMPAGGGLEATANAGAKNDSIPAVRLSMITAPAHTLLLTENARPLNILFSPSGATIRGPGQHIQTRLLDPQEFHNGHINYLMIDGHVEFLYPEESEGKEAGTNSASASPKDYPNVWTIRAND